MAKDYEAQVIELIATDRIYVPVSSMKGKLEKARPTLAKALGLQDGESFDGARVHARVESDDTTMKARTIREAVDQFSAEYPRHGKILEGYIAETRAAKETHLYFGVNAGSRLTTDDYMQVMTGLGFTEITARNLYPELMAVSRNLTRRRGEDERSVLIGKTEE